LSDCLQ